MNEVEQISDNQISDNSVSINNSPQKLKLKIILIIIFLGILLGIAGTLTWFFLQKINISVEVVIDKNENNIANTDELRLQDINVTLHSFDDGNKSESKTGLLVKYEGLPKFSFKYGVYPKLIKYGISVDSKNDCLQLSDKNITFTDIQKINNIKILAVSDCVSGKLFSDINANGVVDENEVGAFFKKVTLKDLDSNTAVYENQTDETGKYEFKNVPRFIGQYPNSKIIHYELSANVDCYRITGTNKPLIFRETGVDVGLAYSCLRGGVYHDRAANGKFDGGDIVLDSGQVDLHIPGEAKIATSTRIDKDGRFIFKGLDHSQYEVVVNKKNFKAVNSAPIVTSLGPNVSLSIGVNCSCIVGWVYLDSNQNEKFDKTETGLSKFKVVVSDSRAPKGERIKPPYLWEVYTDDNGYYIIPNLPNTDYTFHYWVGIAPNSDYDDVNKAYRDHIVKIPPDTIFNFPMIARLDSVTLKTLIFEDKNNNGIQDAGEPGISGVNVGLYNGSGVSGPSKSDGSNTFPSNDPGYYTIIVKIPEGFSYNGVQDNMFINKLIYLKNANSSYNIGLVKNNSKYPVIDLAETYEISGYVFEDVNGNGIKDIGENPITDVNLSAQQFNPTTLIPNSILTFMDTDQNGYYSTLNPQPQFERSSLSAGLYQIGWSNYNKKYIPTTPANLKFVLNENKIINFGVQKVNSSR